MDEPPAPTLSREEFDTLMAEIVAEGAPRRFAVVQEYGDRVDGRVVAWGMAFEDSAQAVAADGSGTLHLSSAEGAVRLFNRAPHITASIAWIDEERPPIDDFLD